jgi:hypothetical protein
VGGQSEFGDLFVRLQSVRYLYKREMSRAVQQDRPPNLIALHAELHSVWYILCVRAGLPPEYGQVPPLQTDRLLEAPSRNMNDLVITLGRPSIHTTLQPLANRESYLGPQPDLEPQEAPPSTASPVSDTVSRSSTCGSPCPPPSSANTTPLEAEQRRQLRNLPPLCLPDPELPDHVTEMFVVFFRFGVVFKLTRIARC